MTVMGLNVSTLLNKFSIIIWQEQIICRGIDIVDDPQTKFSPPHPGTGMNSRVVQHNSDIKAALG